MKQDVRNLELFGGEAWCICIAADEAVRSDSRGHVVCSQHLASLFATVIIGHLHELSSARLRKWLQMGLIPPASPVLTMG